LAAIPILCDSSIDKMATPLEGWAVYGGSVALPDSSKLQGLGRMGPDNDLQSRRQFSKIPLLLRASGRVSIKVAAMSQANALISWGEGASSAPASHLVSEKCVSEDAEPWLVFAGGVWMLEPSCVELIVATGNVASVARLAVGATCD
jgi:hypothetical protein